MACAKAQGPGSAECRIAWRSGRPGQQATVFAALWNGDLDAVAGALGEQGGEGLAVVEISRDEDGARDVALVDVELLEQGTEERNQREIQFCRRLFPQGLKPRLHIVAFAARLKSCPDTMRSLIEFLRSLVHFNGFRRGGFQKLRQIFQKNSRRSTILPARTWKEVTAASRPRVIAEESVSRSAQQCGALFSWSGEGWRVVAQASGGLKLPQSLPRPSCARERAFQFRVAPSSSRRASRTALM